MSAVIGSFVGRTPWTDIAPLPGIEPSALHHDYYFYAPEAQVCAPEGVWVSADDVGWGTSTRPARGGPAWGWSALSLPAQLPPGRSVHPREHDEYSMTAETNYYIGVDV